MPLIGQEQKSCCAYIYMPDKTSVHDVASRTVRLMDSLLPPFLGRRLPTSGDALDLDRNRIDFSATTTVVLPVTDTVTQKSTIVHARAHTCSIPHDANHTATAAKSASYQLDHQQYSTSILQTSHRMSVVVMLVNFRPRHGKKESRVQMIYGNDQSFVCTPSQHTHSHTL